MNYSGYLNQKEHFSVCSQSGAFLLLHEDRGSGHVSSAVRSPWDGGVGWVADDLQCLSVHIQTPYAVSLTLGSL